MSDLVAACWAYLERSSPKRPRRCAKGARGADDRDAMFIHVLGAEVDYARKIGLRLKEPQGLEKASMRSIPQAILERPVETKSR